MRDIFSSGLGKRIHQTFTVTGTTARAFGTRDRDVHQNVFMFLRCNLIPLLTCEHAAVPSLDVLGSTFLSSESRSGAIRGGRGDRVEGSIGRSFLLKLAQCPVLLFDFEISYHSIIQRGLAINQPRFVTQRSNEWVHHHKVLAQALLEHDVMNPFPRQIQYQWRYKF